MLGLLQVVSVCTMGASDSVLPDSSQTIASVVTADSVAKPVEEPKKLTLLQRIYEVVKDFSSIDKRYIEPQHYNYTFMLQNTNTYEVYTLRNKDGREVVLSPEPSVKIGPYVGWRWLVLGYTFDVSHLFDSHPNQNFDISLYSNQVGIDIFYRHTGNDYKIRRTSRRGEEGSTSYLDLPFDGFKASVKGFNFYYILNHKRFSYPAAFNQSTCQKVSCGSPLVGIGYTKHSLNLDIERLYNALQSHLGEQEIVNIDNSFAAAKVNYTDFSVSGGYAYNWVFAKNWVAAASLSLAVAHKRSTGDVENDRFRLRDFSFRNFNLDGLGRFGMVWNNTRWYAGWSAILHSYSYSKSQFSTNSVFGYLNIYSGYNFGNRHSKKKRMARQMK